MIPPLFFLGGVCAWVFRHRWRRRSHGVRFSGGRTVHYGYCSRPRQQQQQGNCRPGLVRGRALWSPAATQGGSSDTRVSRTCGDIAPPHGAPGVDVSSATFSAATETQPRSSVLCLAGGLQHFLSPHRWCRPCTVDAATHIKGNVDQRRTTAYRCGDCRGHPYI